MRILLTGATGFIGARLLPALAERHEVVALARRPPAGGTAEWVEHDLVRPLDEAALPEHVDAVVHLAQSRHYREFPERAGDIFAVNAESTFRLLEYARRAGAERFVFASTGGVYGYGYEKLVETDPVNPIDFYLTSKYVAESLIANYREFFRTVVFRFFFVYGPGQERMLVPTLLDRVLRGEEITVSGRPGLRINPIHVADAVRVFEPALALDRSELFNVAGDETVAIEELVALMGRLSARTVQIADGPRLHDGDLVGDNARMKAVLGVEPQIRLEQGLASML